MASIFTKIIKGEIPSYKIAEDESYLAILDAFPIAKGHTLVIPKVEIDNLFDHSPETLGGILPFAQRVAKSIEKTFPCNRAGMIVIGLEVPHAHIHLLPINKTSDLDFSKPKLKFQPEEFEEVAAALRRNL